MKNLETLNEKALKEEKKNNYSIEQLKGIVRYMYIVEETKIFDKYYLGLYNHVIDEIDLFYISNRFARKTSKRKLLFINRLIEEVNIANYKMNTIYSLSEISEKEESKLNTIIKYIEVQARYTYKTHKFINKKEWLERELRGVELRNLIYGIKK